MLRLAGSDDSGFLATHRGLEEAKRYRSLQRRMLRGYLRVLSHDYHCLHSLAAKSAQKQSASLGLVGERMQFAFSIWSVELRLLLNEVVPCTVNLKPLLERVNELSSRVRETTRRKLGFRAA